MKRSLFETLLGAAIVLGALLFFQYSYQFGGASQADGYTISADFSNVGSLRAGDDVVVSGVKVGSVQSVTLDGGSFLAKVTMVIDPSVQLPLDTAAKISSESLLGGLFLSLEPGAEEDVLEDGGIVEYTQAPQNLEQLLGQFIFSLQDKKSEEE